MRFLYICCFIFLMACNGNNDSTTNNSKKIYTQVLQQQLAVNQSYRVAIEAETITDVDYDLADLSSVTKTNIQLQCNFTTDTVGRKIIAFTFDKIDMYRKNAKGEEESSSENGTASFNINDKILHGIKGSTIKAILNKNQGIDTVEGYKEITDKILKAIKKNSNELSNEIETQIKQMIDQDFIVNNFVKSKMVFKDSILYEGSKWQASLDEGGAILLSGVTNYKIASIKNDVALIEADADIKNATLNNKQLASFSNVNPTLLLNGDYSASFSINIKSGVTQSNKTTTNLKGKLSIMNQEIPIKISVRKKMVIL